MQAMRNLPWYVALIHKLLRPGQSLAMVDRLVWQGDLQGCFETEEKAKQLFEQHNEEVEKVQG